MSDRSRVASMPGVIGVFPWNPVVRRRSPPRPRPASRSLPLKARLSIRACCRRNSVPGDSSPFGVRPLPLQELRERHWKNAITHVQQGEVESSSLSTCRMQIKLLVPIAQAAANLLSDGNFSLIKKCQNRACVLYFYDTTKNRAPVV